MPARKFISRLPGLAATSSLLSMFGAVLMGFGGMLAGGCAIGNGVTGASILAGTAWLALFSMWVGATVTDYLLDQRRVALPA